MDKNLNEILERIKDYLMMELQVDTISERRLAAELSLSASNLSNCKKEDRVPTDKIVDFCLKHRLDLNYILGGNAYKQEISTLPQEVIENTVQLRLFCDIYGSCGGGGESLGDEYETITLDKSVLDGLATSLNYENLECIKTTGDSMEPVIKDGAVIIIDRGDTNIHKPGIFTISTPNGIFVKRIIIGFNGQAELISENKVYPPEKVMVEDLRINGRVIGSIEKI